MRIIGQKPILNVAYYGTNVLLGQGERDGFMLRRGVKELYAQAGWCKEMIFVFCFRINVFYKKAFSIKFYFVL